MGCRWAWSVGPSPPFLLATLPDTNSLLTSRPPLDAKKKWYLFRASPENLRTYQTFPSGKRVSAQERRRRDCYFEYRA